MTDPLARLHNGRSLALGEVPALDPVTFHTAIVSSSRTGRRASALFGVPGAGERVELYAVLAEDAAGTLHVARTTLEERRMAAMTPECPELHLFEREIAEQHGVLFEGHPWPKPVRAASTDYFRVDGEEVHEVAVGPVHAGVIEPGHFRFQCHGEEVFHLEIALGYQHRGVERALLGGPNKRSIHYIETLAGDTSIGHATAYCQILEDLGRSRAPARALALRAVALELERLANHVGGLGALANDVGFLPTASYCGRLRGDFLNLAALACGSRFGRGWVRPGGVGFDLDAERAKQMLTRLSSAAHDVKSAVELLWETASVQARFEGTGTLAREHAEAMGLVGVAARASGLERDVRHDHPTGIYRMTQIPVSVAQSGDVWARAWVRWLEVRRSLTFIREQLEALPSGKVRAALEPLAPSRICASLVEGWRGEICHVALTDASGRFSTYKVVDPSFHNWTGLALALRGQQISDFPLCNKSFDLSYAGFDL